MLKIVRTDSENPDFRTLVSLLDQDLRIRDGDDHAFYAQFNKIVNIPHVVVVYQGQIPVGCGALKKYGPSTAEVKRMFVLPEHRRKGIAGKILTELERWASELEYDELILETGQAQPEAIQLYRNSGYQIMPNYGQYAGVENSVCFKKALHPNK